MTRRWGPRLLDLASDPVGDPTWRAACVGAWGKAGPQGPGDEARACALLRAPLRDQARSSIDGEACETDRRGKRKGEEVENSLTGKESVDKNAVNAPRCTQNL
jgi:hypothetical protein